MLNRQGRPTQGTVSAHEPHATFTGNRALQQIEPLIFEIGHPETTGVDIDAPAPFKSRLGAHARQGEIGLPGLSEPETMRHYVRLSQKNYGIDTGLFPLGSCTMKHNARLNEKTARMPGFSDVHPLQPVSTVPGALEVMLELSRYLMTLTGMPAVALSPKAGAHGEACGMMAIKAAIAALHTGDTPDWPQIAALYGALLDMTGSPVVSSPSRRIQRRSTSTSIRRRSTRMFVSMCRSPAMSAASWKTWFVPGAPCRRSRIRRRRSSGRRASPSGGLAIPSHTRRPRTSSCRNTRCSGSMS